MSKPFSPEATDPPRRSHGAGRTSRRVRAAFGITAGIMALLGAMACCLAPAVASDGPAAPPTEPAGEALYVGGLPVGKVLVLGNSLTLHGPKPDIGWLGNWGMAASAEGKDYVHVLAARLAEAAGEKPHLKVKNIADFERGFDAYDVPAGLKDELAFGADLVVVAVGENVPALPTKQSQDEFARAFARLLAALVSNGRPALFVRSSFWPDPAKDAVMKRACEAAGGVYVDVGGLGKDESNYARAERKIDHAGVANHPGGKGMKAIADALWAAIEKRATAAPPREKSAGNSGK